VLVLSRKKGERIEIGDGITLTVLRITPKSVRLGIEADTRIPVIRGELAQTNSPSSGTGDSQRPQDRVGLPGIAAGYSLGAQPQQTIGPLNRANGQRKRADR
jgi:carbon storage regulator